MLSDCIQSQFHKRNSHLALSLCKKPMARQIKGTMAETISMLKRHNSQSTPNDLLLYL